jgi:hypothetical protein
MTSKKGKRKRRFPAGMTKKRQAQTQIHCGNDKQKSKCKRRFPAGMTNKKASANADSLRE